VPKGTPAPLAEEQPRDETRTVDSPLAALVRPPPADQPATGELLANRYEIGAEVGRGGGGTVYRAFDRGAQLAVALKLLIPHKWPEQQSSEQLYRELRFGRSIQHPNVCRIYDVFEAEGRHYLAMEYASAGTLRGTLREAGADRSLEEKLADAQGVMAGLAAIHRGGLVHRDFKPENILRMVDGRLMVSDFGLTRALDQTTITTGLAGTPGYLAPETLGGAKESQASDVWSLGVVLHEIFQGCRPERVGLQRPPALAPRKGADRREAAVLRVCRACLEPDPGRRPASASEVEALLAKNLRPALAGRRWPWALGLLAAAGGIVGLVVFTRAGPPAAPSQGLTTAAAPDSPMDWSRSRVIIAQPGSFCLDALPPQRRIVRAISQSPPDAIDLDGESGSWSESAVRPERGCAAFSPNGKSVLFTGTLAEGGTQVVLAPAQGAGDGTPLLPGSHARWLASGRDFFFAAEGRRPALGDVDGRIQHRFEEGPAPIEIRDTAVDEVGERAAAVAHYRLPAPETRIEVYDLRARKRLGSWKMATPGTDTVKFDPVRRTFQFPEQRKSEWVWSEITREGRTAVVASLPGKNISGAVRAAGGFLVGVKTRSTAGGLYRIGPHRTEQYISARARQFTVSTGGDVVYLQADRSEPGGTVVLKRTRSSILGLTDADMFGEPTISPDGRTVVFDHRLTGEIFRCDLSSGDHKSKCQLAWVDSGLFPGPGLALHPAGNGVGYVAHPSPSDKGALALRILSLPTRKVRELTRIDSPCRPGCQIYWFSPAVIRLCPTEGSTITEIDVESGRQTSRAVKGELAGACRTSQNDGYRYEMRTRDVVEFRFVPGLVETSP
jgi:hypothetical protein